MKVRWTQHSLRLRITPTELERLQQNLSVTEMLSLRGGGWSIAIETSDSPTRLSAAQGALTLFLAANDVNKLAVPETEGVYFRCEGDPPLRYYIEKDFPCIHPRPAEAQEQPSETFDTPFQL